MKKLLLFDTETLKTKTVLDNVGKYSVFDAKHGRKEIYILAFLLFVAVFFGIYGILKVNNHRLKEIATIINVSDSLATKNEIEELHYIAGYLSFQTEHSKPTEDTVYKFITNCNPWYPNIIMGQAIIESGCGTSAVAKNANNLFGMKAIDQSKPHRPTTQIPNTDYKGYGVYASWELSVVDRILWELHRFRNKKPSYSNYKAGFSNYAETENYIETVESIANKYKSK